MTTAINVLVADDSAFMRKMISGMLESDSRLHVVGTARNGEEAIQKVAELKPDVLTLDIEMPGMNGLEALQVIMTTTPLPVLMVSSLTTEGARETLKALELGAVDFIAKQLDGVITNISSIQRELVEKVVTAATIRVRSPSLSAPVASLRPAMSTPTLSARAVSGTRGNKLIAIGCSTGGPQALLELLPAFPKDIGAGIVIVQHMPKLFTKPFAERMNEVCQIEVREAKEADVVEAGTALVAPGGLHLRVVRRRATQVEIALSGDSEGSTYVPSVDVMMKSVASVYRERAVGVVLTGMGHDGRDGMRAIKEAKGRTLVQDEASSIVHGMPKAVIDDGLAEKIVPLPQLSHEIMNMI